MIFIDESGLLMAPLVRRTWSLRGSRPILRQQGKQRDKVSIAGAFCWSPRRQNRLGFVFETLVNKYYNNERSADFLEMLMREFPQKIIVIWDGGTMHEGDPIWEAVEDFQPRLQVELLPPYAPMLNPVEQIWSWLKYSRLCNYAPPNAVTFNQVIERELTEIVADQDFLLSMWLGSELPVPQALLI